MNLEELRRLVEKKTKYLATFDALADEADAELVELERRLGEMEEAEPSDDGERRGK